MRFTYIYRKYIHAIGYYIKLWEETDFVKETEAPAEPLPVAIPISHLKKGTLYRVGLTNQWGGIA